MIWWVVLILTAGLIEYVAWKHGATLSQHWWRFQQVHRWARALMVVALGVLITHLGWGWP